MLILTATHALLGAPLLAALGTLATSAAPTTLRSEPEPRVQLAAQVSDPSPGGTWIEELALARVRANGAALSPAELVAILRNGSAPLLAVSAAASEPDEESEAEQLNERLDALASDTWGRAALFARHAARPADVEKCDLAAWLVFRGDATAAVAVVATLATDDHTPKATLLRVWSKLHGDALEEDPTGLIESLARVRNALRGEFVALADECDRLLRTATQQAIERWKASSGEEPAGWMFGAYPPAETASERVRHDESRCAELLAQIGALPATLADRDARELELLAQACAADVLAAEPWFRSAVVHNRRGESVLALADVDSGLRRAPASVRGWTIRAATTEVLGDVRATSLAVERALELEPGDAELELRYCACLVRLGHLDEAAIAARDVVRSNPDDPWAAIAFVLGQRNVSGTFDAENRALLQPHVRHWDDGARLWAAATLAVVDGKFDRDVTNALTELETRRGSDELGRAAHALLQNDAAFPLWGGVAAWARGDRKSAGERWARDAAGTGTAAIAARGFVAHFGGAHGWDDLPKLPESANEPRVELPDESAVAVRVPGEARDIERAIQLLPAGARRIVLARGTHVAPATLDVGVDLFGIGFDTVVKTAKGAQGTLEIDPGVDASVRLFELQWDSFTEVRSGRVVAQRVRSKTSWLFTDANAYQVERPSLFHEVTFHAACELRGSAARVRIEDCTWIAPLAPARPLRVWQGRAELVRCMIQEATNWGTPITVESKDAHVLVEDCRIVGCPASDRVPRIVIDVRDGGQAILRRTHIVDLEPITSPAVVAENCTFRRTRAHPADLPGWTAQGAVLEPLRAGLAELNVPGDFDRLNQALAAAEPGSTIRIGPGLHELDADLARDVNLIGAGMNKTLLQSSSGRNTIAIRGAHVVVNELMLVGEGLALERNGDELRVPMLWSGAPGEAVPRLVTLRDGSLAFGTNAIARDPRGLRFDVGAGCTVSGRLGVWMLGVVPIADLQDDALVAVMLDLELRLWLEHGFAWSAPRGDDPGRAHRPLSVASSGAPEEHERALRAERLRRIDEWLTRGWPDGGGALLADVAPRIWSLAPEAERAAAVLARIEPRMSALARTDPRAGVEELITLVMSDLGGGYDDRHILEAFIPAIRAFVEHTPAAELPYVKARLQGLDKAQADSKARLALCLDARAQGRVDQCLALAEGLDPVSRADVLSRFMPTRLSFDEVERLLKTPDLRSDLRERLNTWRRNLVTGDYVPPPRLSWLGAWQMKEQAERTGVGNAYFAIREVYNPYGFVRYEAVARPDPNEGGAQFGAQHSARPVPPQPGATDIEWDQFYARLAAWKP